MTILLTASRLTATTHQLTSVEPRTINISFTTLLRVSLLKSEKKDIRTPISMTYPHLGSDPRKKKNTRPPFSAINYVLNYPNVKLCLQITRKVRSE